MNTYPHPSAKLVLTPTTHLRLSIGLGWLGLFLVLAGFEASAATYYSQGSLSPTAVGSWNSIRGGGGSAPANFSTVGDVFVIQTNHTMTATTTWAVAGNIQVESGGTLNAGDGTTTSATALITCPTFQVDNGGTFVLNYKHGANGSSTSIPGTNRIFAASSTVEIKFWGDGTGTSPNAMPSGVSWGNLTINVATLGGSWNQSGGITDIKGNFTIKATGGGSFEFRLSSSTIYTLTIGGDLIIQGGILSGYSNSAMLDGCVIKLYGNYSQSLGTTFKTTSSTTGGILSFIFDSTGGPGSVSFIQAGTFQVNRVKFFVGAGKTVTLNSAFPTGSNSPTNAITVSGTLLCNGFNVTGAEPFTLAAGGTLGITDAKGITATGGGTNGNIQVTGTRTFDSAANYIYYGTAAAAVTGNGLPTTVNNLTITNANGVTLSGNVQVNGTLSMSAGQLVLGGNTLSYGASGTLQYNSTSGAQTTDAAEFPGSSGPAGLKIANASGVILNFPRTITGTLTLTSGNLTTTAANLLTIGASGAVSGGSSSSYVNGPLAQVYGGTGARTFPIGVSPNFRQVSLNLTGISGTPTLTITPNEPSTWNGANTPASTTMFGDRDWTINCSSSGNTATLTLDGTGFIASGAARIVGFDGAATTAFSPTFVSPNYSATGIALASGNNEIALGDLACAAPATPTFSSVTAPACGAVSVNWNAASGAATYDLFRKLSGGAYPVTPLASGLSGTTYSDSDITNGVTYVYALKAWSSCGAASLQSADSDPVTPTTAPFIFNSPASLMTYEGIPASFTVSARGDGLTYQWQVNKGSGFGNVDSGGADGTGGTTTTFTTVNATSAMDGYQYRCVVSGNCPPSANSAVATLTLGNQFRSLASGPWAANTSWQISADGITWVNAPVGAYPGANPGHNDSVRIRAGHTITIAATTTALAGAVTIDATGKLSLGDQVSSSDANTVLQISGNLTNSGTITAGQGNNNRILFTGTTTWTGSGDLTCGNQGKVGFTVMSGATLNLSVDVTLRNSTSQAVVTINGSLFAGTHTIKQVTASASSSASLVVGAGATLETANAGGIGGTNNTSSGLFQSPFGTVSLNAAASLIFDGVVAQTTTVGPTIIPAVKNLTITNSAGVTLTSGMVISGQLQINSGTLNPNGTTSSTVASLSFDSGATTQLAGTWGASGATHNDSAHFAGSGYVTVFLNNDGANQFRTKVSGNWNTPATWEISSDGVTWLSSPLYPAANNTAAVQAGHTVTLAQAEACGVITVSPTAILNLNGFGLAAANASGLSGELRMKVTRAGGVFTGSKLTQTSGTLTLNGGLTVTVLGEPLAGGDVVDLFDASAFGGAIDATNLPSLGTGLNWWKGNLTVDGSLIVNRAPTLSDKSYTRAAGVSLTILKSALLSDASDPDSGDSASYDVLTSTGSQGATVTENATSILYEPGTNANDTLSFRVKDTRGGTVVKNITITVDNSSAGGSAQGITPTVNGMQVTFAGIPNLKYDVERAEDANFTVNLVSPLVTTNAPANGIFSIVDPTPPSPTAFYRLKFNPN